MLKRLFIILFIISAAIVYSIYQKNVMESQLAPQGQGDAILGKLPVASFVDLEGKNVSLQEIYSSPVELLVVHFWGTWCGPCEAELPELLAFIRRFEQRPGVKFLLVAVNDDVNKVRKHVKSLPNNKAIWLLDNDQVHSEVFGTTRVPETFVFSSDMTTLRKFVGPQDWNKPMFFQAFDELLLISTRKL